MTTNRKGTIEDDAPEEPVPVEEAAPIEEEAPVEPAPVSPPVDEVDEEEEEDLLDLDTADPATELWAGGPTVGMVNAWKTEFEVYVTTLNPYTNNHVVWRPLNRHEYRVLVKQLEDAVASGLSQVEATMNNEELMTEVVVLFPEYNRHDRKATLAGMPQLISQEVMEVSGFVPTEVRQL